MKAACSSIGTSRYKLIFIRSVSMDVSWPSSLSWRSYSLQSKTMSFVHVECIYSSTQLFLEMALETSWLVLAASITSSLPTASAWVNFLSTSNSEICWACTSSKYFSKFFIDTEILPSCYLKRLFRSFWIISIDYFILSSYLLKFPSIRLMTLFMTSACMLSYKSLSRSASAAASSSGD